MGIAYRKTENSSDGKQAEKMTDWMKNVYSYSLNLYYIYTFIR